jgi:hypothetical protein
MIKAFISISLIYLIFPSDFFAFLNYIDSTYAAMVPTDVVLVYRII